MATPAVSALLMALHLDLPRRLLQMNNAQTLAEPNQSNGGASAAVKASKIAMQLTEKPGRGSSDEKKLTKEEKEELEAEANPAIKAAIKTLNDAIEDCKSMVEGYTGTGLANTVSSLKRYTESSRLKSGFTQAQVDAVSLFWV